MNDDMIDRAARVLFGADDHWRRPRIPWAEANDDQRAPYRHMTQSMFEAAGEGLRLAGIDLEAAGLSHIDAFVLGTWTTEQIKAAEQRGYYRALDEFNIERDAAQLAANEARGLR